MPYPDVHATVRMLVEQVPERLLWGSDLPHIFFKNGMLNDGDPIELFARWVPDEKLRERILLSNPANLNDFPRVARS